MIVNEKLLGEIKPDNRAQVAYDRLLSMLTSEERAVITQISRDAALVSDAVSLVSDAIVDETDNVS